MDQHEKISNNEHFETSVRLATEKLLNVFELIEQTESEEKIMERGAQVLVAYECLIVSINKLNLQDQEDPFTIDPDLVVAQEKFEQNFKNRYGEEIFNQAVQQAQESLPQDYRDTVNINTISDIIHFWTDKNGVERSTVEPWMIPSQAELKGYSVIKPVYQFATREEAAAQTRGTGSVVEISAGDQTSWVVFKRVSDGVDTTKLRSYLAYDGGHDSMDDTVARLPGLQVIDVGRYDIKTMERLPSERLGNATQDYEGWK